MAALKHFMLVLVAVSSAKVVKLPPRAADIPIPIPDQHDYVLSAGSANLTISAFNNLLTLHDPDFDMTEAGTAKGTFADVDLEVSHYLLTGKYDIVSIKGDGTISLKFYPTITVTYDPISASNPCPQKITNYLIEMTKVDLKITGLYADSFHIDDIADTFVSSHPKEITEGLNKYLNTEDAHNYIDSTVINKVLNNFC